MSFVYSHALCAFSNGKFEVGQPSIKGGALYVIIEMYSKVVLDFAYSHALEKFKKKLFEQS